MLHLGCENQLNVAVAFQVYIDLCEVRVLRDVEYAFIRDIGLIYLTGRESHSSEEPEIYIPLSATSKVDLSWLKRVQNILCSGQDKKRVTLALKAQDSTIVYYKMTEGIVPPDSPETARQKKLLTEKRHFLGLEVHQRQSELMNRAYAYKQAAKNVERNSLQTDEHKPNGMDKSVVTKIEENRSSANNIDMTEGAADRDNLNKEEILSANKRTDSTNSPEIQEI